MFEPVQHRFCKTFHYLVAFARERSEVAAPIDLKRGLTVYSVAGVIAAPPPDS